MKSSLGTRLLLAFPASVQQRKALKTQSRCAMACRFCQNSIFIAIWPTNGYLEKHALVLNTCLELQGFVNTRFALWGFVNTRLELCKGICIDNTVRPYCIIYGICKYPLRTTGICKYPPRTTGICKYSHRRLQNPPTMQRDRLEINMYSRG